MPAPVFLPHLACHPVVTVTQVQVAGQEQRPRAGVTSECVTEDVLSPCSHQPRNAPGRAGNGLVVVVVVVVSFLEASLPQQVTAKILS